MKAFSSHFYRFCSMYESSSKSASSGSSFLYFLFDLFFRPALNDSLGSFLFTYATSHFSVLVLRRWLSLSSISLKGLISVFIYFLKKSISNGTDMFPLDNAWSCLTSNSSCEENLSRLKVRVSHSLLIRSLNALYLCTISLMRCKCVGGSGDG